VEGREGRGGWRGGVGGMVGGARALHRRRLLRTNFHRGPIDSAIGHRATEIRRRWRHRGSHRTHRSDDNTAKSGAARPEIVNLERAIGGLRYGFLHVPASKVYVSLDESATTSTARVPGGAATPGLLARDEGDALWSCCCGDCLRAVVAVDDRVATLECLCRSRCGWLRPPGHHQLHAEGTRVGQRCVWSE